VPNRRALLTPLVDLQALTFTPTSHRPSSPKGWRAMPRYRPGCELPRSVPVTNSVTRHPDEPDLMTIPVKKAPRRTRVHCWANPHSPRNLPRPGSRPTGEPVDSLTQSCHRRTAPRQAGRLLGGDRWKVVPAPIPLTPRGTDTVLRHRPEGLYRT
jgi:hypothetical protein